ncbi:MAG: flagellar biosynthetic protein FliR [Alphaproteobacteria bacterium]|nr:flagellar biosynthetic protein FliR [Alphaproteobacteria bacterium]
MHNTLQDIITGEVSAFLLIFMRFGVALMIMPGIGEMFVSPQIRLNFAIALSFVLTPFLAHSLPPLPGDAVPMVELLLSEAFIGFFIGTVMRILVSALDTAGMIISIQAGYSNAQVFNPVTSTQGSLVGSLYSTLGVTLLFVTNMDHYMLASVVESYRIFPSTGSLIDVESAYHVILNVVSIAFKTGVQLAMPFLLVGLLLQIALGVMGRLMPQIQIFFLAMPVQIFISLVIMTMVISAGMLYWLDNFQSVLAGAFLQ